MLVQTFFIFSKHTYILRIIESSLLMKNKFLISLFLTLFPFISQAQLLNSKTEFTRADSLRGGLNSFRTCYDVKYYNLSLKVEPDKKFISGSNEITFLCLRPFTKLQIDLFENMKIKGISFQGVPLKYTRELNAVFVEFPQTLQKDSLYRFRVEYFGFPQIAKNPPWDGGFTWTKDEIKNPWVAVSCQGTGASLWWPNKDHQSDEPDSMSIKIAVPNGLKDISNGRLVNTVDLGDGFTRYDWFVKNPINNYDVTLNIGDYDQFSESFQDLSCDYFVLPEHETEARNQFAQVRTMLTCFLKYIGHYPFPEDGYKLVETPYLGMEHQSAIAYGNHFKNGYLGQDLSRTGYGLSWDYILVHESAHEWFGNNITTKDIADMWVHEAFATYMEGLFVECTQSYDHGQDYIQGLRALILNDRPCIGIYGVNKEGSEDMYFKGANLLNTVRHIIKNDSLWFSILKNMNLDFRHQTVDGNQIMDYISKKSHMDLIPVFKQYLATIDIPRLKLRWKNSHRLEFKWENTIPGFKMPVDLVKKDHSEIRIYPESTSWKSLDLNQKENSEIHPDTRSFYINY